MCTDKSYINTKVCFNFIVTLREYFLSNLDSFKLHVLFLFMQLQLLRYLSKLLLYVFFVFFCSNGYSLYCAELMVNMKDVPSTERMVLCSKQWKMMTQKEKDMFQKRCEQVCLSNSIRIKMIKEIIMINISMVTY